MSENWNALWLASGMTNTEARGLFGADVEKADGFFEIEYMSCSYWVRCPGHSTERPELGGRRSDIDVSFQAPRRSEAPEPLALKEASFVARLVSREDEVTMGFYHHEGVPYFVWDHEVSSFVFNSAPNIWYTPESFELRKAVRSSRYPFSAENLGSLDWPFGLYEVLVDEGGSEKLSGIWFDVGARVFAGRAMAVAAELGVTCGLSWSDPWSKGALVEPIGLKAFIVTLCDPGVSVHSDEGVSESKRAVLVEAVAVLSRTKGSDLPELPEDIEGEAAELAESLT